MNAEIAAAAIRDFQETFGAVRREIARVVVGHDEVIDAILAALFARRPRADRGRARAPARR